jgi:hypothetical protein
MGDSVIKTPQKISVPTIPALAIIYATYLQPSFIVTRVAERAMSINNSFGGKWVWDSRLYGLVVRVSGFRSKMCCVSCEVQTEFIYVM